jgi:hypothetical protein
VKYSRYCPALLSPSPIQNPGPKPYVKPGVKTQKTRHIGALQFLEETEKNTDTPGFRSPASGGH